MSGAFFSETGGRAVERPAWSLPLRLTLTAGALYCLGARCLRGVAGWESVREFYQLDLSQGASWALFGLAVYAGPYLVLAALLGALWGRSPWAGRLALAGLWAGGLLCLGEGLTWLARGINGHGGYVGAEPLLALGAWLMCALALFLTRRRV